eukprot:6977175-Lingulodinium_polyedra.AAC.1
MTGPPQVTTSILRLPVAPSKRKSCQLCGARSTDPSLFLNTVYEDCVGGSGHGSDTLSLRVARRVCLVCGNMCSRKHHWATLGQG